MESLQKNLINGLRKGETILPAIECYNLIEDYLLSIDTVELAGKVLLNFLKNPKNFTLCRYPIMLCCLVAEFMSKLKKRFPFYEPFFAQIDLGFQKAGELFASKIKDPKVISYHLNIKDIQDRNSLQIMAQNRLYSILRADYIGNIIDKNWSGKNILYGIADMSSLTYLMRYEVEDKVFKFENFSEIYTRHKHFFTNYYSYRDVPSIRYYFKESYGFLLLIMYQILIYKSVIDLNLENTVNTYYYGFSRTLYFMSMGQSFDKVNSMIFFTFVQRWYIEMDPFILWLSFAAVVFIHWFDFKSVFISEEDENSLKKKELVDAIFLSYQFTFLWYKILESLKATKTYGGFLRTVGVIFKKMVLILVLLYCFILLMTTIFNLVFQQTIQFQDYFDSFFYMAQASQQEYTLGSQWNSIVKFGLIIYIGFCTLVVINLIIALETKIYDDASNDVLPEHRANLINLTEYLNWDENFGIFKFLFAPLNVIQFPFSIFILFVEDKKNWTKIITKILFFFVALLFFFVFILYQIYNLPFAIVHFILIYPLKYGTTPKKLLIHFVGAVPFVLYYFIRDIGNFWHLVFRVEDDESEEENNIEGKIKEFKKTFSNMINIVSQQIESNKKCKRFFITELYENWQKAIFEENNKNKKRNFFVNNMHKKKLLLKRKKEKMRFITGTNSNNLIQLSNDEGGNYKNTNDVDTNIVFLSEQKTKVQAFLKRFSDKEGFIDKDIAKNLFPKKIYYDDDYFKFIYYFSFSHFKNIINYFTKMTNEIKRDMTQLREACLIYRKINEKFKNIKQLLKRYSFKHQEINSMDFDLNNINFSLAGLENHLTNEQAKSLFDNMMKGVPSKSAKDNHFFKAT